MLRNNRIKYKMHGLVIVTALVTAYVRRVVQYKEYYWPSIESFLSWWLIHYFAILIVIIGFYVLAVKSHIFFFEEDKNKISTETASIYVALVLLVFSIFVFVAAHWPASDGFFE